MKRRYKAGHWIRVPLGGEHDALGIITRMCRSRLFGYFFPVAASHVPSHGDLRALKARDAVAVLLFGGKPIERARWQIVATSLPFDPAAWPFPDFASRGAFGESWTRVRYDGQTMQIVERTSIDSELAADLPDARFADAHEAEALLRARIAGQPPQRAFAVCEVRSPVDMRHLQTVESGGRIQFSTPITSADVAQIARFVQAHPLVGVRVHGFPDGFDAAPLANLSTLRELALDVGRIARPETLRALRELRRLRIGAARTTLEFIEHLPLLRELELRGTRAPLEPLLRAPALQTLMLENTPPLDLPALASAHMLEKLVLAHGAYDLSALHRLTNLRRLELRALEIETLPPLSALKYLRELHLDGLTGIHDISVAAEAPALRELRVTRMPQLNVGDFTPLQRCAGLRRLDVAIGSRRKEREINRLMKAGNRWQL